MSSPSSLVSGSANPRVSGRKNARNPAITAREPKITSGKGAHSLSSVSMKGANMVATRENVEHVPTAIVL